MKIKWNKKKLKRNCGLEEEEINKKESKWWKRKMKIKWNKKKLKRNCYLEEKEKVNDVEEKN